MNGKRPLLDGQLKYQCCSFCQVTPVVLLEYSKKKKSIHHPRKVPRDYNHQNLKPPPNQPLCLLHFYTTDACLQVTTSRESKEQQYTIATIIDSIALQQQLPRQQELFAEAFLQIQQQIQDVMQQQEHVELSANNNNEDPLAIITDLNKGYGNSSPRAYPPYDRLKSLLPRMKKVKPQNASPEGGFLRHVPIPERIVQVQQQQVQLQKELIARMNQNSNHNTDPESSRDVHNTTGISIASSKTNPVDVTQRRKPTRTNVWNIISQEDRKHAATATATSIRPTTLSDDIQHQDTSVICTCGSTMVEVLSSNTNKSQDMTKAETWGNKDRHDEIIHRYLCHHCGKSWNDVE